MRGKGANDESGGRSTRSERSTRRNSAETPSSSVNGRGRADEDTSLWTTRRSERSTRYSTDSATVTPSSKQKQEEETGPWGTRRSSRRVAEKEERRVDRADQDGNEDEVRTPLCYNLNYSRSI